MNTATITPTIVAAAHADIVSTTRHQLARFPVSPLYPFARMSDVRAASKQAGGHFFDRDTMHEHRSIVESELYAGVLFITSEVTWGQERRRYAIRYVIPTGAIYTLTEVHRFDTIEQARDMARQVAKRIREGGSLL